MSKLSKLTSDNYSYFIEDYKRGIDVMSNTTLFLNLVIGLIILLLLLSVGLRMIRGYGFFESFNLFASPGRKNEFKNNKQIEFTNEKENEIDANDRKK